MPGYTCIVYGETHDILTVEIIHGTDVSAVADKVLRKARDVPGAQHCDLWEESRELGTFFVSDGHGLARPA